MNLSLIVARSKNKVIGDGSKMPWNIPEDLQYFKNTTMGSDCIVGRKTYLTLPKEGLPGRKLIVLTSKKFEDLANVKFVSSVQGALNACTTDEAFCIGGLSVYKLFLPYCNRIYLTEIKAEYEGSVYFTDDYLKGFKTTKCVETKLCKYFTMIRK